MKTKTLLRRALFAPSLAASLAAWLPTMAVTFTNDARIGIHDTNFDGQDIVVGPCTLTVDGSHAFASLQVLTGGALTHTFSTNGLLNDLLAVTGEHYVLSGTNPVLLAQSIVIAGTIAVTDLSGSTNYHLGTDYLAQTNQFGNATLARVAGSTIPDGATISVSYEALVPLVPTGLNLVVTNGVEVEAGGAINADGRGYGGGYGSGAGAKRTVSSPYVFTSGGGGGYGGSGGSSSGLAGGGIGYGSITTPTNTGSGGGLGSGPGGPGGGAIHLSIGGQLRVDGKITANGADGVSPHSGGGSGGSLWLSAAACSGAGSISANGGAGEPRDGGGGGGGRIAVYTGAVQAAASPFAGSTSARGGPGATSGGPGTIYLQGTSHPEGLVQIDNGGQPGTTTLASGSGVFDLATGGGAVVWLSLAANVPLKLINVMVGSNSWLSAPPAGSTTGLVQMTVLSNLTIEAGGGILADGQGYQGGVGPGAGGRNSATNASGGGGGHGGPGGTGFGGAAGGGAYGSFSNPHEAGSGGGSGHLGALGGAGGGVIALTVNGLLVVNGAVSANGSAGTNPGDGGGAGGSISLTVGSLSGGGVIAANGGPGQLPFGGGGGGGRIAIYANHSFAGSLEAHGGPGAANGGAGTIYRKGEPSSTAQLRVDNGGLPAPTNTPLLSVSSAIDLAVVGGARANLFGPSASASLRSLDLGSNSWLSYSPPYVLGGQALTLTVSNNATIEAGGGILLDGLGSVGGQGSGAGQTSLSPTSSIRAGTGGGNGGLGGPSAFGAFGGNAYGTFSSPGQWGSGGGNSLGGLGNGPGGTGGGGLLLSVGGRLALDGIISADGTAGVGQGAGGGSGGTIRLTVGSLTGGGLISANGGSGDLPYGGGGGGGRIEVLSSTGEAALASFTGKLRARGGTGANYGGAGTIFLQPGNSSPAQLILDNGGAQGASTPIPLSSLTSPAPYNLTVDGGAVGLASGLFGTPPLTIANLQVGSNSWLICSNSAARSVSGQRLSLTVLSNAIIQTGGGISLDGQGNPVSQGTGAPTTEFSRYGSGGAGYGGGGGSGLYGTPGGKTYGSTAAPIDAGSGGGPNIELPSQSNSGAGGGALQMTVEGTLALDGKLSADGEAGLAGGGGSGGSLWLAARALTGAGLISANGGAGDGSSGGGGGGRVALYFTTNKFKGVLSARGGAGYNYGGAGTIYLLASNGPSAQVIVDNGGVRGIGSLLSLSGGAPVNLTVSGGAHANLAGSVTISNLLIASLSSLTYSNPIPSALMNVSGNATIQAGAALSVDGLGYPAEQGPGAGQNVSASGVTTGGGGGYGGNGGSGAFGTPGGPAYGSLFSPAATGSGGAIGTGQGANTGSSGGGALRLSVSRVLVLDGTISANGADASTPSGGGGSGGSLWLTVGTLSGAGVISADGGAGDLPNGGAGGGGRIALYCLTNAFKGTISAHGGPGATYGGAGTVYLSTQAPSQALAVPQVLVENGGWAGASTPLGSLQGVDLTVGGAALVTASNSTIRNLVIYSNSWLGQAPVHQNQTVAPALRFTVTADATIQAGGGITLDGTGDPYGQGPGAGHALQIGVAGSGGSYAGFGGAGVSNAPVGAAYGSLLQPVDPGSGGGGYPLGITGAGSAGGGALQLTVAGNLVLNGRISADGGGAIYEGFGGGSGGGLWLSAGKLSGNGVISADGGPGDLLEGGGGGGGRIAVYFGTNTFTGSLSAHGGEGANAGGAGTIYSRATAANSGDLIIDNAGLRGTNTPLSTPEAFNLTVSGAAVACPTPSAPALLLSSLLVDSGGVLTGLSGETNLDLMVLGQATVGSNGWISADAQGYSGANGGPGAGSMPNGYSGSSAGYGGGGGASLGGTPGGATYGSAEQPVDWGSRGGLSPAYANFCQGGGAIRLQVGGPFILNGRLTANGNAALFEGAGGGAGGSVWVTTGQLEGSGLMAAGGGAGDPHEGGGGGGGRIALYCLSNNFTGSIAAPGGPGAFPGANGTVFLSAALPTQAVLAQSPTGLVSFAVSNVLLTFNSPIDLTSLSGANFRIITPGGVLPQALVKLSPPNPYVLQAAFAPQTEAGYYEIYLGPQVRNIYGVPIGAPYAGSFVVLPPSLTGRVTDTNGLPVPYVTLGAGGSLPPRITDSNGLYSLEVPPSWSGTVTPVKAQALFLPASRGYTNVTANLANQDFLMMTPPAPALTFKNHGSNFELAWQGLPGASHQLLWSTNLVDWLPCGPALPGANGPMRVAVPLRLEPAKFFRIRTSPY